jgi:hypothetical protein
MANKAIETRKFYGKVIGKRIWMVFKVKGEWHALFLDFHLGKGPYWANEVRSLKKGKAWIDREARGRNVKTERDVEDMMEGFDL